MSVILERLEREAEARSRQHRSRSLVHGRGIAFTSNDYLGMSREPAIAMALAAAISRGVAHGATGSRLLSGHHPEHREAEERFATFAGRERALLLGSGYLANLGVLTALASRRDLVVLDRAAHASLKEGARASMATHRTFAHNDPDDLRRTLRDRCRHDGALVVVEGIYSMDGDAADLPEIARVVAEHDAELIVDEAHATGLFGDRLRGVHETCTLPRRPLATVHPCGKALGCSGALVAADAIVIDAIVNTARPFIYSTAPSPLQAVAIVASLELLPTLGDRVERIFALAARLRDGLGGLRRWRVVASQGPIIAIVIGSSADALCAAAELQRRGFDVRAVRPPTVSEGSARIRVTITSDRTEEEVDRLAGAIIETEDGFPEQIDA